MNQLEMLRPASEIGKTKIVALQYYVNLKLEGETLEADNLLQDAPQIMHVGIAAYRHMGRQEGLLYTLGQIPNEKYKIMHNFAQQKFAEKAFDTTLTTRSVLEVIKTKDALEEYITDVYLDPLV